MLVLGYDPGGAGANGAAIARVAEEGTELIAVSTLESVDEVMLFFQNNAHDDDVVAAGIDTYLTWATGMSGWRPMDTHLRRRYPAVQHSVFASNSASGSMAVQGMAMALRLKQLWPEIILNETHPKVLYYALTEPHAIYRYDQDMIGWLQQRIDFRPRVTINNEHEWDAALSAWATAAALSRGDEWLDLVPQLPNGLLLPAGAVNYFWVA